MKNYNRRETYDTTRKYWYDQKPDETHAEFCTRVCKEIQNSKEEIVVCNFMNRCVYIATDFFS